MKKFIISEQEKDEILGQHKEMKDIQMDRRMLDANKCFVTFKDIKEWFE